MLLYELKYEALIYQHSLNSSQLKRVFGVKDAGFYLTPTVFYDSHINTSIDRALKVPTRFYKAQH